MTFAPRAGAPPVARILTAIIALAVLLAMVAMPAAADRGPVRLSSPSESPSDGTTETPFTFTLFYRHRAGSPPASIQVVVGGTAFPMVGDGTDNWKRGVTFSFATLLPTGNHPVLFVAGDPDGNEDTIAGGQVRVAQVPPPPAPEPTPGSLQTAAPSARPTPAPTPQATSAPRETAAPRPHATPVPAAVVNPSTAPDAVPDPAAPDGTPGDSSPEPSTTGAGGSGPSGGASPAGGSGAEPGGPATPNGNGPGEATAGMPVGWGDLTRYLEALGLDPAGSPYLRLIPVMIWTTGGVAMAMAFGFFGKRRRDGEPPEPDEVLSAKAARGTGEAATAALVPAAAQTPLDLELAMPRWRRPSLLQARKADPLRTGVTRPRLSFDNAAVAPYEGYERRLIRYLVVQLLDTPDEFRGAEIGSLAQGDEIQLLEQSGTYWRVLCPDGSHGWIHRMTLGDVVGEAPSPTARDTWATTSTSAEADDVDDDVLVAFMTARGRA